MAANFPSSPVVGDTYTVGSIVYIWNGTSWTSTYHPKWTYIAHAISGNTVTFTNIPQYYGDLYLQICYLDDSGTYMALEISGDNGATWSAGGYYASLKAGDYYNGGILIQNYTADSGMAWGAGNVNINGIITSSVDYEASPMTWRITGGIDGIRLNAGTAFDWTYAIVVLRGR